ncbi:hypothetical protein VaNZ11_013928, partial [Volvox africanus]
VAIPFMLSSRSLVFVSQSARRVAPFSASLVQRRLHTTQASASSTGKMTATGNSTTKLYVGNLSWETRADDLNSLFSKFGAVEDAFVATDRETGRSRGFGFVTLESTAAKAAAVGIDGSEFMGRTIKVNEATPQADRTGGRGGGGGYGGRGRGRGGYGDGGGYGGGGRGYGGGRGGGGYGGGGYGSGGYGGGGYGGGGYGGY